MGLDLILPLSSKSVFLFLKMGPPHLHPQWAPQTAKLILNKRQGCGKGQKLPKAGGSVAPPHCTRPGVGMGVGTDKWRRGAVLQEPNQTDLDGVPPAQGEELG